MDLKEIKQIIELMNKHGLVHFELERDGQKVVLKKNGDLEAVQRCLASLPAAAAPPAQPAAPPEAAPAQPAPADPAPEPQGDFIKSPMVGTFYLSPSPDDPPFVKPGDTVEEDTVVCIIEAMKVMNEIKAETSGTISKTLVDDAAPVQYGEPLFELKKS